MQGDFDGFTAFCTLFIISFVVLCMTVQSNMGA